MADDSAVRRGRRPARTADQIRAEMIAVGVELLEARGLTVGFETVRFDEVIGASDVPRASAYRAWSSESDDGPQVRFHDALAAKLLMDQPGFGVEARDGTEGTLNATIDAVSKVLEQMPDLDELTPDERTFWLRQALRAGANANQYSMDDSNLWRSYVAIAAGLTTQQSTDDTLLAAWREGEERLVERYKDLYQSMAELFGLRIRDCYTYGQFDTAAAALAEGLTIRTKVNPHVRGTSRNTGRDGQPQDWTLFAISFEGLVRQFFEPADDPPRTPMRHEP